MLLISSPAGLDELSIASTPYFLAHFANTTCKKWFVISLKSSITLIVSSEIWYLSFRAKITPWIFTYLYGLEILLRVRDLLKVVFLVAEIVWFTSFIVNHGYCSCIVIHSIMYLLRLFNRFMQHSSYNNNTYNFQLAHPDTLFTSKPSILHSSTS